MPNQLDDLYSRIGPPPETPGDTRFLGWDFNRAERADAALKRQLWLQRAAIENARLANPLSVGQATAIAPGTESLATPAEMMRQTTVEPSAVPTYRSPMRMKTIEPPAAMQPPQMGFGNTPADSIGNAINQLDYMIDKTDRFLNPRTPYQVPDVNIRGVEQANMFPLASQGRVTQPTNDMLVPQQGPPQTINRDVVNPNAPANPAMRNVVDARVHAMGSPLFGRGSAALQTLGQKLDMAYDYFRSIGLDDAEAMASAKRHTSGIDKVENLEKERGARGAREDEKIGLHKRSVKVAEDRLQLQQDIEARKATELAAMKAAGMDDASIKAARLKWDQRKFQLTLEAYMRAKMAGDITPELDQAFMNDLTGFGSGLETGPVGNQLDLPFNLGTLPLPGSKTGPLGTTPGQPTQPAPAKPAPTESGADDELKRLQSILDSKPDDEKSGLEGRTMSGGKYTIRKGKVERTGK